MGENTVIEKSRLSAVEETNLFITTCLGAKNKAYCVENEIRCITTSDNKEVKFKIKNGLVIPFLEISLPKSALKNIVIGPTNNSNLTMQSILHFL